MRVLALFELAVGLASGCVALLFFTSMAGIAEFEATIQGVLFWLTLCLGPILLVVGAILELARPTGKLGATLILAGAATLTCWAIYFAVVDTTGQPDGRVDLRRLLIPASALVIALASDVAACRIWTLTAALRAGMKPR